VGAKFERRSLQARRIADEVISPIGGVSRGEKKRGEGGAAEGFIGEGGVEKGLGFGVCGARSTARRNRARAGLLPGEGDDPDRWATLVGVWQGEAGTDSGRLGLGPWARSGLGPDLVPWPLTLFFCSFFSFSVFLICSIIFAKMIQIKPRQFFLYNSK
jgi:hypothetical protein